MPAAVANSVVDCASAMRHHSQIANGTASDKFRNVRDALNFCPSHTAIMSDEKNGGSNYLQAWREHRRMTREALASHVGTTAAVIWHLEQGERGLSAKWLRKLAPPLMTTPGHLLDLHPHDATDDVVELWTSIPAKDKPRARAVLEAFRTGTDD